MVTSHYRRLNIILKYLGEEKVNNIEDYISKIENREYIMFKSEEEINQFFGDIFDTFYKQSTEEEILILRSYSGDQYRDINAVLRDNWNYERNGLLTEEKKQKNLEYAQNIKEMISRLPILSNNIKVYRGVPLSIFKGYGISSLDDLLFLKGQYFLDSGFTSTSLIRENSFFYKELEWHEACNVEIEYLIPEECSDGFPLVHNEFSYSIKQNEFLLKAGNLSKILDVTVDKNEEKAYVKMAFIPSRIWNFTLSEEYNRHNGFSK